MADSKPLTAITITTATPKIREFVPKGEWREEGLGHYDPLSIPNPNTLPKTNRKDWKGKQE